MRNTVLVVAAHPDDEVLMCGATLAKHVQQGDRVHLLFLADGESARFGDPADPAVKPAIDARKSAAAEAAGVIGAEAPRFLDLPDNRLDGVPQLDITKGVEAVVAETAPTIVYTHSVLDLNLDHQVAHRAVVTACRPLPGRSVRAIYAGETLSSTEWGIGQRFKPARYVDISETLETKLAALRTYGNEIAAPPHPRSEDAVKALACLRGSEVGVAQAEAFEVIREIA